MFAWGLLAIQMIRFGKRLIVGLLWQSSSIDVSHIVLLHLCCECMQHAERCSLNFEGKKVLACCLKT